MKSNILTNSGVIEVDVKITRATKIHIRIKENGSVNVTCPANVPFKKIEDFVCKKSDWILFHSNKMREKYQKLQNATIESIFILGNKYLLQNVSKEQIQANTFGVKLPNLRSKTSDICFASNVIYLLGDKQKAEKKLKKKLAEFALLYFEECVQSVKQQLNVQNQIEVAVKNVKSWLGLCNPKENKITFNLRLISREKEVIDSVVYHEFAHFEVPNHSKAFYAVLLKMCPQYYSLNKQIKNSKYDLTDKFFSDK